MAKSVIGGDFQLVFNGVEVDRYVKATPAPTDGRTIFFIGRHEPRKGLQVLLEAMAHLPGDVRLWVAGSGPDTGALQRQWGHDERIEWLGQISDAEKRARLAGAHVFCAPSLGGESFGVVLLEGMAARTPVVASDLAGYRNVATHRTDALLVPPSDPEALAREIGWVLDDASVAASLIAGGEVRAAELSMENLARLYLDIYADLA
jgi:phosphatidylinositol alpha-mannosyltransferase